MKATIALVLASLALVVAVAAPFWCYYDLQKQLAPVSASVQALENTAKTNRALIEAQAVQSNTPMPSIVTETDWRQAWESIPACGGLEQALPAPEKLRILGLQGLIDQGYAAVRICYDATSKHAAFILAKKVLTTPGPGIAPTCVDACDQDIFGVIHGDTKSLKYLESAGRLGIFGEAYDQYCLIDKELNDEETGSEKILFYCGSGESGGLAAWYQFEMKNDTLTTVQTLVEKGPPERFDVKDAELLKLFSRQAN